MRKLYISGPMTGLPNYNELEFYRAQELLADFGFMPEATEEVLRSGCGGSSA